MCLEAMAACDARVKYVLRISDQAAVYDVVNGFSHILRHVAPLKP